MAPAVDLPKLISFFFHLNGTIVAIESNTGSIASMMLSRYRAEPCEAATRPNIVVRMIEGQLPPTPAKRGSFRNNEIQFIADDKYFVVAYLRGNPWHVEITAYECLSENLVASIFDPLLSTCLAR